MARKKGYSGSSRTTDKAPYWKRLDPVAELGYGGTWTDRDDNERSDFEANVFDDRNETGNIYVQLRATGRDFKNVTFRFEGLDEFAEFVGDFDDVLADLKGPAKPTRSRKAAPVDDTDDDDDAPAPRRRKAGAKTTTTARKRR